MYCKSADYVLPYYLMNFLANFYLFSGLVLLYSNIVSVFHTVMTIITALYFLN